MRKRRLCAARFLQRWRSGRTRTTRNRVYPHKGNKGSNPFLCAKPLETQYLVFRGVFLYRILIFSHKKTLKTSKHTQNVTEKFFLRYCVFCTAVI